MKTDILLLLSAILSANGYKQAYHDYDDTEYYMPDDDPAQDDIIFVLRHLLKSVAKNNYDPMTTADGNLQMRAPFLRELPGKEKGQSRKMKVCMLLEGEEFCTDDHVTHSKLLHADRKKPMKEYTCITVMGRKYCVARFEKLAPAIDPDYVDPEGDEKL